MIEQEVMGDEANISLTKSLIFRLEAGMLDSDEKKLTGLGTCIDVKMKRYSLLFSVNGGAFAIAL